MYELDTLQLKGDGCPSGYLPKNSPVTPVLIQASTTEQCQVVLGSVWDDPAERGNEEPQVLVSAHIGANSTVLALNAGTPEVAHAAGW